MFTKHITHMWELNELLIKNITTQYKDNIIKYKI